jgi:dihydropyrimidinase
MRILIKNGTVVTAAETLRADVLIEGERIAAVAPGIDVEADRTIDAAGRYVLPGGVDVHTHLDMPYRDTVSADDFQSGTIAAALGATTSIIDFATQMPGETLHEARDAWMQKAEGKAAIDYGFHVAITRMDGGVEREMDELVLEGVTSFKVYMAYPGSLMLDDAGIRRALEKSRDNGATICVHAEDGVAVEALIRDALAAGHTAPRYHALTRPPEAEAAAARRVIALARSARAPIYIVHVSASGAVDAIRGAREDGLPVSGETCPQYLFLSDDRYEAPGFEAAKYVMSPPLRPKAMQERLWLALASGDLQVVATDHCPFTLAQKAEGRDDFTKIPNGAPGIETRMSLLYDGGVRANRITLNRFVELTSTSPAKLFGLFPRKGTIAHGSDADVVLFDPDRKTTLSASTLHMRVDYSPYEGRQVTGIAETVLSRGRVIVENGAFVGRPGWGTFLRREPRNT